MNYCSNCGTKVVGNYCTNCGAKIASGDNNYVPNNNVTYTINQSQNKNNYDAYRISVGIIMIIISGLVLLGGMDSGTVIHTSYFTIDVNAALVMPGLIAIIGGILSVVSIKSNPLLVISAAFYYIAAVINAFAIRDISILFILCGVFGSLNIAFFLKTNH